MPQLRIRAISVRGVNSNDKEIRLKLSSKKGKAKTKVGKKPDEGGTVDFSNEQPFVLPVSGAKGGVKIEVLSKNKSLGILNLDDLSDLVQGEERVSWEPLPGNKIYIYIGLTAEGFGASKAKASAPKTPRKSLDSDVDPSMPPTEELNRLYEKLMKELGLNEAALGKASEVSNEHKWSMILQQRKVQESRNQGRIEGSPPYWINKVKAEPSISILKGLQAVLSTEPLDWLTSFIDGGGLAAILDLLGEVEQSLHHKSQFRQLRKEDEEVQMQAELIKCLRPLTNNQAGIQGLMSSHDGVNKVVICLNIAQIPGWIENIEWMKTILKILTLVCFMEEQDGHKLVMNGMAHYKNKNQESRRFETLVRNFRSAVHLDLRVAYMTFINAVINVPSDTDMRVAIRNEFLRLGLKDIIQEMKAKCDESDIELTTQFDVFDEESQVDYHTIHDRFAMLDVDINDVEDIFNALRVQLNGAGLQKNFLGLMQNLMSIPVQSETGTRSFILLCKIVRHIALHKEKIGKDQQSIGNLLSTMDENMDIKPLLSSIDDQMTDIPLSKRVYELGEECDRLRKLVKTLEIEVKEKEEQLKMGGGGKGTGTGGGGLDGVKDRKVDETPTETPEEDINSSAPPPPPPPGAPAPPPPPGGPTAQPKRTPKTVPKSKMKGWQWSKIPYLKLKGTYFEKYTPVYNGLDIDYSDLEKTFSAKVIEKKKKPEKEKVKTVHILENKVATNLSIFLSQFKCTHNEILKGIMDMNETMLSEDNIKELINFIPSSNDVQNIQEYLSTGDPTRLGEAEKFSLALSRVPQVHIRLNAFRFKSSFYPAKVNIKPDLEVLRQACLETQACKTFYNFMELLLEMGNFLNHSTNRSNAWGFTFNSLVKVPDLRSTDLSKNFAQYIAEFLQKKAPSWLDFEQEIPHLEAASKINLGVLTGDLFTLNNNFKSISAEVKNVESTTKADKFGKKMKKFIKDAGKDMEIMLAKHKETVAFFESLVKFFGEDPLKTSPEQFFGTLLHFTKIIKASIQDIEKAKEDEEKAIRRKKAKEKREQEMLQKRKDKYGDNSEASINELFQNIEDGQVFRKRRKKKGKDIFLHRQEARVREKPLPDVKRKPRTREELAAKDW